MALQNAFTALLEEKRFEDLTLNELCSRAMIRRTTFYKHFADKYEYLSFYMKEIGQSFQQQLPPDIASTDTKAYFRCMYRELIQFMEQHEKMVKNIMSSNLFPIFTDSLTELITEDTLQVLRQVPAFKDTPQSQLEHMSAFYSGGIVNTLRLSLEKGIRIRETDFTSSVNAFLALNL